MERYIALLEGIGFPEKAARIYLTLLEHGQLSISEIQTHSNLHRVEIYRLLPLLLERAFIKITLIGKRKKYFPASPIKIREAYDEMQTFNKGSIDALIEDYSHLNKKPLVSFHEGKKGVQQVFHDIIDSQKKGDVFYRVSSEIDTEMINKTYLPKNYREKRDNKELERYVIMSSKAAQNKRKRLERDLVVIPENIDEFEDNVLMSIYANKVCYIDFNSETSIIIENKQIADFQKKLFRLLYKKLQ